MIDRATLEARRTELQAEAEKAREVALRLQGALILCDEFLALLEKDGADEVHSEDGLPVELGQSNTG